MENVDSLEDLKKQIVGDENINSINITSVNILFLDISSSCTGYAIGAVDFTDKKIKWKSSGAIWLDPKWSHQEKYLYMYEAIVNYFWIIGQIDYMVVEQYSINPKRMSGVQVVSEMQGAIKTAAAQHGVTVTSVLPQTWRAQLGIKKRKLESGKFDYKEPTKEKIAKYVEVPETSISNITRNTRTTPSDVYDALAIGIGWLKKIGLTNNDFSEIEFNPHIGALGEI